MNISVSPVGIVNPNVPGQGIQDIVNAGFGNVFLELNMCCSPQELEQAGMPMDREEGQLADSEKANGTEILAEEKQEQPAGTSANRESRNPSDVISVADHPEALGERLSRMVNQCREKGLRVSVARAPYLPRDTKRADLRELLLKIQEESIRYCGEIGCRYLIVRPWSVKGKQEWDVNRDGYLRLATLAREHQVMLLLENQCRWMNGHLVRGLCSDGRTAAEWVGRLNEEAGEERFGFCMDVGTCNLCGQDMHEFAGSLGSRIRAVILRDCDGHQENSLLPFTCTYQGQTQTDWLSLIRGLREISFDGELVLEFSGTLAGFSPLLRPQLMTLARATAEYFRWQTEIETQLKRYRSIVLFGAGNMCRNYMKCYGEKYPPLFTCDNNPKLWGTSLCGLEVRPPEALKDLTDDCGVLICNIYYREIEAQLRELGVKNIGFFNDEYMPSFHFDRLKEV